MRRLVEMSAAGMHIARPNASAAAAAARPASPRQHPYGMHAHQELEVCLPLSGRMELDLGGRHLALAPRQVVVVAPGTMHCEGCVGRGAPYSVLWLTCVRGELFGFIVYYSDGRWQDGSYRLLGSRHARHLAESVESGSRRRAQWAAHLRLCLLGIVGDWALRESEQRLAGDRGKPPASMHQATLDRLKRVLDDQLGSRIPVQQLARQTHLSPNYLNSLFRQWSGQSIHRYVLQRRMERAMELCRRGDLLIKQIALQVGYADSLYFSRAFHRYFGQWPTQVRSHGDPAHTQRLMPATG